MTTQLSAADLQRRLDLEGAPDPFPSLHSPVKSRVAVTPRPVVTDTESFPSLTPSVPSNGASVKPAWGNGAGPRIKAALSAQYLATDSFTLADIDLSKAGKDGKPATLGEIMKGVMTRYKIKVEASTNRASRETTFQLKAETEKDLLKARRELLSALSPIVTVILNAPASTIPSIIGVKGATLKQIRDQTSVKVDIPRRDNLSTETNGHHSSGTATPLPQAQEDDEEPTIPVTITGPQPMVEEAKAILKAIISSKTSKITQRVRDIPAHIFPFVMSHRPTFLAAAEDGDIHVAGNEAVREITVSGDREAVIRAIEVIKATVESYKTGLTSLKISLPKRQHRLLSGKDNEDILAKSSCSAIVAPAEDPSDEITVWGKPEHLAQGLTAVIEKANSRYIHEFPLPGPVSLSKQLLTYFNRINYSKTLTSAHPGASVYTPHQAVVDKAKGLNIDIVGEKSIVDAVVTQISELIGKLIGGVKEVPIDWLVHRVIMGKYAKKIKQYYDVHNVQVFFPAEAAEQSSVLLVYDPLSSSASLSPVEKESHLAEVSKDLLKLAKDAADVKSESITVDSKWHEAVKGPNGTTLNAIIGEDKSLSIKFVADSSDSTQGTILVRGPREDVDNAVQRIQSIVEDAKNDEIVNSYSTEFDIDKEFVGRIVGAQGAGINKLRDQLGVRVDVNDHEDKEMVVGKKKKATYLKSKVTITGRKENVEDAKKRILTQIDRLADETSEHLKIPAEYHSGLIGQSGKYAIRLEEKYSVKITFPRHSADGEGRTREQLKSDEVLIKGGRKGVAGAKTELLDAVEFEKESNHVLKFTIPTRAVARVLGKGGASINEIKDDTGAQIDVDKADDSAALTHIQVRGTKAAISAAKTAILAISDQVGEETTDSVYIDNKFHRTIIGVGGQGLKDLVQKCGGPSDSKLQAGLIRFPRQGDSSDEVRLRGDPKLVAKIKAELEKATASLRDRIVLAVDVPGGQHRALIGRGGQHLNDLQDKYTVQVQFPGSRSYHQVGQPENIADLADVDPANIVKVSGSKSAVAAAIEDLKSQVKAPAPDAVTATVTVPLKYHHIISQQGSFFRNLRSYGVQVDQSGHPQKSAVPPHPPKPEAAASARIDDTTDELASESLWQVTSNYQDAEEGDSEWTLKARDQAGLDKAQKAVQDAIANAERMTHVGFLTLADRSTFPRIVGSKGATVSRLRSETGADITVSREDSTIVIIGTESAILAAKDAILTLVSSPARPRRND